jgi:pimeloyl-ACP methyl ester carboxylesterase
MIALLLAVQAAGSYVEVQYPPSTTPGELVFGVTYTLWVPPTQARLRGVIVHQHGCGSGACKGGSTAAYDLHWQALARAWDCALLGPSYHQEDGQNCRDWCDPRNGSEKAYLKALADLAAKAGRPEIATVPWALWGHSGGGTWASRMTALHPDRVVAAWLRSGTSFGKPGAEEIPAAALGVPLMCNPGAKEKGDKRFDGAWTGGFAHFQAWRALGAPIGFAPDPRTSHECGDSRYLAIPWFDACLRMRLPDEAGGKLKPVDPKSAWLAAPLGEVAVAADKYEGKAEEAVWLPGPRAAAAWSEYVKTGFVSDATPPPAPVEVKLERTDAGVVLTWSVLADLESGVRGFVIRRDGKDVAQVPEKPVGRFGKPLFQPMSYHDTPEKPLPAPRWVDAGAPAGAEYRVVAVNAAGLESEPSAPVSLR